MAEANHGKLETKDDADHAARQREAVEKLLARSAVVSEGAVVPAGRPGPLRYEARVEFLPVAAAGFEGTGGEPQAAVMATSYRRLAVRAPERPVCFAFNGGPGSASIWLHLGALGPKRVVVPDDGSAPRAPYALVDNPLTWFDHFDLVFIDPPHTGWSLAAGAEARKRMHGVDGDVDTLCEVIRAWLTRHQRWHSPIYVAGESYGTTRGAAIADKLQTIGVALSGLILVSCATDLQTLVFAPGNELPYALFLPAFANVAQYHGLLKGTPGASGEAARVAAEEFVADEYAAVLHLGARIDAKRAGRAARRVAELTGLPQALVEARNLRIDDRTFFTDAMRAQGRIVGRLDARVTGPMGAVRGHDYEFDPGIDAIVGPYTMAAMAYYGQTLGVHSEQRYEVLNREVHESWNWNRGKAQGNSYACTSPDLARALRRNPHLRVFVASGRYDLGTPFSATEWTLAHLDVPNEVAQRVEHHYYDAGHMMYTRSVDLLKMKNDLAKWLGMLPVQ